MQKYRIIHISDPHFCVRPNEVNFAQLWRDNKQGSLILEGAGLTKVARPEFGGMPSIKASLRSRRLRDLASDFHFSSYRPLLAEQFARFANINRGRFDLIVCTGDLSTTGDQADLQQANKYLNSDPHWGEFSNQKYYEPISKLGVPLLLLPGNHDRYKNGKGDSGGVEFNHVFSAAWPDKLRSHVQWDVIDKKGEFPLGVIAADFCLKVNSDASQNGKDVMSHVLGRGKFYDDVANQLVDATNEARSKHKAKAVIWAIHFPPSPNILNTDLILIEGQKVIDLAKENGVELLLSGHLHETGIWREGGPTVFSAGTFCAVEFVSAPSFHILEIDVATIGISGIIRRNMNWNFSSRKFVESPSIDLIVR